LRPCCPWIDLILFLREFAPSYGHARIEICCELADVPDRVCRWVRGCLGSSPSRDVQDCGGLVGGRECSVPDAFVGASVGLFRSCDNRLAVAAPAEMPARKPMSSALI
jgi:hypothetical protein